MNTWEKVYTVVAVVLAPSLVGLLLLVPELRQLDRLLALGLFGMVVNVGLMVVVLRDIFLRQFDLPNMRFIWIALVLLIWPSIVYYLLRYGFRPRN